MLSTWEIRIDWEGILTSLEGEVSDKNNPVSKESFEVLNTPLPSPGRRLLAN